MRKPLIAGNWKMHGSLLQVQALIEGLKQRTQACHEIEILIIPTFVHLMKANMLLAQSAILLGAQNLYLGTEGAYTGEIAGPMLKEIGCDYVLVGHSERRVLFYEGLELIAAKCKAAMIAGLRPILCVGETRAERERGKTEAVIQTQIESVIEIVGIEVLTHAAIAYEPVWAIGTGLTASAEEAQAAHAFIRRLIAQNNVDLANTIRILYGGSMKADNAAALLAMPDIDGGLIGGASLEVDSFFAICKAAQTKVEKNSLGTCQGLNG